ncbi:unnamed protein product, partial [Rotaria sp. Silwood1]
MSRFADVDLSNEKRPLNSSYRSKPLLSLENALEPIIPRIKHLRQRIEEAMQNCRFPSEHNLTRDQSASVYLYTMEWGNNSLYKIMNQNLRSEDDSATIPWFNYLKLFETALKKLPTVKKCLWRGMDGTVNKNFVKGIEIIWRSVSSCSTSLNVIKDFLGKESNATLFMIEAVNGRNLHGYTRYPGENEVLLGPGTRLRVESDDLKHIGGLKVVHLVEIAENNDEILGTAIES